MKFGEVQGEWGLCYWDNRGGFGVGLWKTIREAGIIRNGRKTKSGNIVVFSLIVSHNFDKGLHRL